MISHRRVRRESDELLCTVWVARYGPQSVARRGGGKWLKTEHKLTADFPEEKRNYRGRSIPVRCLVVPQSILTGCQYSRRRASEDEPRRATLWGKQFNMRRLSTKSPPLRTLPTRAYLICLLAVTKPRSARLLESSAVMRTPSPGEPRWKTRFFAPSPPFANPYLSPSTRTRSQRSSIQRSQWSSVGCLLSAGQVQLFSSWHATSVGKREFPWHFPGFWGIGKKREREREREISSRAKQLDEIRRGSRSGILSAAFSWITTLFVLPCDPDELRGKATGFKRREGGVRGRRAGF